MKKRAFFAMILVVTFATSTIACSKTESKTGAENASIANTTAVETADGRFIEELPEKDCNGAEFRFLVQDDPCFRHLYDVNTEEENGDSINDAVYQRNRMVEANYNVVIKDTKDANADKAIFSAVNAGDTSYQATWLRVDNFFAQSINGIFYNLHDVPHLNLEKLYWDQNVVRDFTIGDKLYGIMGDISTSVSVFTHLFGVNKKLAANYNISMEELYQTVKDGKWTLDKMGELFKQVAYADLNGDSKRDGLDQYAFGVSPAIFEAGFSAAGEKWIEKDSNDNLVLSKLTERKVNALQKLVDITAEKQTTISTWNIGAVEGVSDTYGYTYYDKFINNTVFMVDIDLGIVMDYRKKMEDDFGIVPLPKLEESQETYSVYAYPFFPLLSVPVTVVGEQLEMTGIVLEALAAESYRKLTPAFYDIAIKGKYTRDEGSIEMLDLILRSRIYDPLYFNAWMKGDFRNSLSTTMTGNKMEIASLYAKKEPKMNDELTKTKEQFMERE